MPNTTLTQFPTGQTQYKINFDYLARPFVVVTLVNSNDVTQNRVLTVGDDYGFINPTTIEIYTSQAGFDILQIHRFTSTELLVEFRDGSVLTATDLTNAELQAIHIAEEGRDQTTGLAKQYADQAVEAGKDAQDILNQIILLGKNGYTPVGSFENGGTVSLQNDVLQHGSGTNTTHWRWDGTLPKEVPPGSTPAGSGGIGPGAWVDVTDATLRGQLASPNGGDYVYVGNKSVTEILSETESLVLPIRFTTEWLTPLLTGVNPQGLAVDNDYIYVTEDTTPSGGAYTCKVKRISRTTMDVEYHPSTFGCHGQGIGLLADGRIFIGGSSDSNITVINFSDGSSLQQSCVGFMKDFPFCYDIESDMIYQLQDATATSGNLIRVAALDRTTGFKSDFYLSEEITATGYAQGIATDGTSLWIHTGGSWTSGVNGTPTWNLWRTSIGGVVLDRRTFRRNDMYKLVSGATSSTVHEPQGLFRHGGKLYFMHYIGVPGDVKTVVFSENTSGTFVRAQPANKWYIYRDLSELGLGTLTSGSSIRSIVEKMKDFSSVTFSMSGESYFTADTGIAFGLCTVYRVNANRAYAVAVECNSSVPSYDYRSKTSTVAVYGTSQSLPTITRSRLASAALEYTGGAVISGPITVGVSRVLTCESLTILITHTASTNPATPHTFSRAEIDYFIASGESLYIGDQTGAISFKFTNTGLSVLGGSGSAIIKKIIAI